MAERSEGTRSKPGTRVIKGKTGRSAAAPAGRFVQIAADEIPSPTPQDMDRLKAAMQIPTKDSEVEESGALVGPGSQVRRDESAQILRPPLGPVRSAILASLGRNRMTRYKLWRRAHAHCPTLSASAVYEYLRGFRNIGSEYVEALVEAAGLELVDRRGVKARKPSAASTRSRRRLPLSAASDADLPVYSKSRTKKRPGS
jgi:hypothetical protein